MKLWWGVWLRDWIGFLIIYDIRIYATMVCLIGGDAHTLSVPCCNYLASQCIVHEAQELAVDVSPLFLRRCSSER